MLLEDVNGLIEVGADCCDILREFGYSEPIADMRVALRSHLSALRVRLEEAERERGKEYYFRFPRSTDYCGPYRSIEEMREDSAWKHPEWTPVWRLKGISPGPYHEFDRDAAISATTAQPEATCKDSLQVQPPVVAESATTQTAQPEESREA